MYMYVYMYGLRISVSLISEAPRGEIVVLAEEVMDSKYTISMQLSAGHLDKKDFFGKVRADKLHVSTCTCTCMCHTMPHCPVNL